MEWLDIDWIEVWTAVWEGVGLVSLIGVIVVVFLFFLPAVMGVGA